MDGWTDGRTDGRRTEHSRAPYYKLPPPTEEEAKKLQSKIKNRGKDNLRSHQEGTQASISAPTPQYY